MNLEREDYETARPRMKPGDVIAFGGKGYFSEIAKFITSSDISHVGVILQMKMIDDDTGRYLNLIIQTKRAYDIFGIGIHRFSDILDFYEGEIWWLPMDEELRNNKFDQTSFFNFMFNQAKHSMRYDIPQAMKSSLDALGKIKFGLHGPGHTSEEFFKCYTSQLIGAGFEASGLVGNISAKDVSPIDLCRWEIYQDTYYQIKGEKDKIISRYNTLSPSIWGT